MLATVLMPVIKMAVDQSLAFLSCAEPAAI
jgi:hypothetical protein